MDAEEAAVRAVGDWLVAEGMTAWVIDGPEPGQPIEVQLHWEHRSHREKISSRFGASVVVSILPPDAPRYAPA